MAGGLEGLARCFLRCFFWRTRIVDYVTALLSQIHSGAFQGRPRGDRWIANASRESSHSSVLGVEPECSSVREPERAAADISSRSQR